MKKFFLFLVALLSIVACSKSDSGSSGNNGSNDGTYTVKVVKNPNVTLSSIAVMAQHICLTTLTHFLKMTTQKNSK